MTARRVIAGSVAAVALAMAGVFASTAGAEESRTLARKSVPAARSGLGSFTPASADPKLAAALARAGLTGTGFRFTPSIAERGVGRSVTVAVRARSNRAAAPDRVSATAPVALAPIAYNLGVAVGWKRFALSGDLARVDLAGQPGSRESAGVGVSYTGRSFSGRVNAEAARPLANQPRLIAETPSYSIDVGGSYKLARNLDLTAGVRYRAEDDRLPRLTDDTRRDSQSVYVGTAFRF